MSVEQRKEKKREQDKAYREKNNVNEYKRQYTAERRSDYLKSDIYANRDIERYKNERDYAIELFVVFCITYKRFSIKYYRDRA